jgi:hypothetical protein
MVKKRSEILVDVAGSSSHGGFGMDDGSKEEPRRHGATQPLRPKSNQKGRRFGGMLGLGPKKSQPLMQGRLRPGPSGNSPIRASPPSSQSRNRPNKSNSSQLNLQSTGRKRNTVHDGVSLPTGATSMAGGQDHVDMRASQESLPPRSISGSPTTRKPKSPGRKRPAALSMNRASPGKSNAELGGM